MVHLAPQATPQNPQAAPEAPRPPNQAAPEAPRPPNQAAPEAPRPPNQAAPPHAPPNSDIQAYCICLLGNPARVAVLEHNRRVLPSLVTVEGVDGALMTREDVTRMTEVGFLVPEGGRYVDRYVHGRRMNSGNVAAFVGHRTAIAAIEAQGPEYGVILEDDVAVHPDFAERVAGILREAERRGVTFDLLNLHVFEGQRRYLPASDEFRSAPSGFWGLQCYVVPKARARAVLDALWPMRGAVDEQITRVGLDHKVYFDGPLFDSAKIPSHTDATRTLNDILGT